MSYKQEIKEAKTGRGLVAFLVLLFSLSSFMACCQQDKFTQVGGQTFTGGGATVDTDSQSLSIDRDTLFISRGNQVKLPIDWGTYKPTVTSLSGGQVSAFSIDDAHWQQVGNIVSMTGEFSVFIDLDSLGVNDYTVSFSIDLPVASNFTSSQDGHLVFTTDSGGGGPTPGALEGYQLGGFAVASSTTDQLNFTMRVAHNSTQFDDTTYRLVFSGHYIVK